MPSVQQLRSFFSTLRFRLVVWTTLVVFVMVVVTNITIREIEHQALRQNYDQFLRDSCEDVNLVVARFKEDDQKKLFRELQEKVEVYKNRGWFLQLFDSKRQPVWSSVDPTTLPLPIFASNVTEPFDAQKHRVYEKKLKKPSGDDYYLRCGFLQVELQEDIEVLNRTILIAGIAILLAAPLGAYVIALRATRPINQIIATTGHLQPNNLNERLPIRGTGDELDQLSRTINGMLDRLASYIEQNRDFVANAAHELRSPLTAIRSSVEVALNKSRTTEEYASVLTDVMEEVGRLAGLVNRMLILAEGDAGRLEPRDQTAHLDKIVRESIDMFEAVAESRGVRLTLGKVSSAVVPGEEAYLRQVVRNLVDNAIKYNRTSGEVVVQLHTDQLNKVATLTVEDTGIGIDPDVLPRIFERFYRADRARTREKSQTGYGLGLSICQAIIRALQGEISAESRPGGGSKFTVVLPLATGTLPASPATDELAAAKRRP